MAGRPVYSRSVPTVGRRQGCVGQKVRIGVEGYEKLKRLVAEIEPDLQKAEGGNKAAGTRVRQAMQDIKATAQEIREQILELRDKGDAAAPKGD